MATKRRIFHHWQTPDGRRIHYQEQYLAAPPCPRPVDLPDPAPLFPPAASWAFSYQAESHILTATINIPDTDSPAPSSSGLTLSLAIYRQQRLPADLIPGWPEAILQCNVFQFSNHWLNPPKRTYSREFESSLIRSFWDIDTSSLYLFIRINPHPVLSKSNKTKVLARTNGSTLIPTAPLWPPLFTSLAIYQFSSPW
jgi:hypothetical protein